MANKAETSVRVNTKTAPGLSKTDTVKLAVAILLVSSAIYAFYFFESYSSLVRVIGLLIISGGALALAYHTAPGRELWQFALDSRMEVRKIVWPTRQETLQTTLVVFLMTIIMGILLWLFDMLLMEIVKFLTGQGSA